MLTTGTDEDEDKDEVVAGVTGVVIDSTGTDTDGTDGTDGTNTTVVLTATTLLVTLAGQLGTVAAHDVMVS